MRAMRVLPDLPRPRPARAVLEGHYARLEPLDPARHGADLHAASFAPGREERMHNLPSVPRDREGCAAWLAATAAADDPLVFAVVDRASGSCGGRQALMRIVPEHGVIELGGILWGPAVARTRVATDAFALAASYAFDVLGYRRFEWKCDADNAPSRRAAAGS